MTFVLRSIRDRRQDRARGRARQHACGLAAPPLPTQLGIRPSRAAMARGAANRARCEREGNFPVPQRERLLRSQVLPREAAGEHSCCLSVSFYVCFFPGEKKKKKILSWLICQAMRELLALLHSLAMKNSSPHSGGAQHKQLYLSPAVLLRRRYSFV